MADNNVEPCRSHTTFGKRNHSINNHIQANAEPMEPHNTVEASDEYAIASSSKVNSLREEIGFRPIHPHENVVIIADTLNNEEQAINRNSHENTSDNIIDIADIPLGCSEATLRQCAAELSQEKKSNNERNDCKLEESTTVPLLREKVKNNKYYLSRLSRNLSFLTDYQFFIGMKVLCFIARCIFIAFLILFSKGYTFFYMWLLLALPPICELICIFCLKPFVLDNKVFLFDFILSMAGFLSIIYINFTILGLIEWLSIIALIITCVTILAVSYFAGKMDVIGDWKIYHSMRYKFAMSIPHLILVGLVYGLFFVLHKNLGIMNAAVFSAVVLTGIVGFKARLGLLYKKKLLSYIFIICDSFLNAFLFPLLLLITGFYADTCLQALFV